MSNSAAAQEPSMEEILASIRRIITDEEGAPAINQNLQGDDSGLQSPQELDSTDTEDSLLSTSQPMSPDDLDALFAPDDDEEDVSEKPAAAPSKPVAFQTDDVEQSPQDGKPGDEEVMELTADEIEDDADFSSDDELELVEGMDIFFEGDEDDSRMSKAEQKPAGAAIPDPAAKPATPRSSIESLISSKAADSVSQSFSSLSGLVVQSQAKTMEDLLKEMLKPMLQSWLDENLPSLVEDMVAAEIRRLSGKK